MKVPVVASRIGGIPESVQDGVGGILVPPRDSTALANALLAILKDRDLRLRLGEQGRRYVEQNFNWKNTIDHMVEVYHQLLNGCSNAEEVRPTP